MSFFVFPVCHYILGLLLKYKILFLCSVACGGGLRMRFSLDAVCPSLLYVFPKCVRRNCRANKWISNLSHDLNFDVAEKKEIAYRNLDRMLSWAELCPERNWRAGKLVSQNEGVNCLALHWASNRTEFVHYIERTAAKKRVLNTRNWTEERHLPIIN